MKLVLAVPFLLFSGPVHSATTIYSDRALFESQLVESVVDDYEHPNYIYHQSDLYMSQVRGETRYTALSFPNQNFTFDQGDGNHKYCAGCNGAYLLDFTDTSVSGPTGVDAVGFNFINEQALRLFSAFVTFGDGSTEAYPLPYVPSDDLHLNFFGIVSDKQIAAIRMDSDPGTDVTTGSFAQDHLTIGRVVPEPSTIMLATGLVLIGSCRRQIGR